MRSPSWRPRAAVIGATVVALVAVNGPASSAAPPSAAPTTPPPSQRPLGTGPTGEAPASTASTPLAGSTQVTLLTGDVVSYLPGANGGTPQVQVSMAPRPDGRAVSFTQLRQGDAFYVFPSDARGLVGTGRLDRDLFDVAYLANNGYADDRAAQLPVIVQYPGATGSGSDPKILTRRADALPATTAVHALPTVGSAVVKVTKKQAARFWASVDAPGPGARATLDSGVSKIWLDHRTKALLDQSVPQIGAPAAWQAGYDGKGVKVAVLDTGVDATHPDLAGKILDSKSFIEGQAVKDGHGHGTHVASTIVGSGAASGGKYKGVAPGAELIVGKILGDDGYGSDSAIIAGMQWAAQSGAKIVSISVGGVLTDGTDPMSQAVNELSEQYGTLFVIAAGNTAGPMQQINAPGAADAALTVAAVDKQDQMANFSSRGPRLGDFALKPDIAAPGVNITAARAEGTTTGPIVDDEYTTISGTSMATPHVSGAAAILAQEHPDWSGQKIKQVLTSTSKDLGHGPYAQGAGRVDLVRATTQRVYATGNVDFGLLTYPQTAPATKPLTYVNDGDAPVTLDLSTTLTSTTGTAPAGALTISPSTVTVPAHGTAQVTVTLDATGGELTSYLGSVHATGGDVQVTTAAAGFAEPKMATLTAKVINPPGATDVTYGGFLALRLDDQPEYSPLGLSEPTQEHTGRLIAGVYSVGTDVTWRDAAGEINHALVTNPTVDLTNSDATVVFDLRKAQPVTVRTPKASVPYQVVLGYTDITERSKYKLEQYYNLPYGEARVWTLPTASATRGTFNSYTQFLTGVEPLTMAVRGPGHTRLTPHYQGVGADVAKLDGRQTLPVVDGGTGKPADLAGRDVRGKLVLLDLSDICPQDLPADSFPCNEDGLDRVEAAQQAGAVGVLGYGAVGRSFLNPSSWFAWEQWWPTYPIPTMSLTAKEGRLLAGMLARRPVSVDVDATAVTPYVYPLTFVQSGRIPGGAHAVTPGELYQVENRLHADTDGTAALSFLPILAGPKLLRQTGISVPAPATVTSYVGPAQKNLAWSEDATYFYPSGYRGWSGGYMDLVDRGGKIVRDWGEQPLVPASMQISPETLDYNWQMCLSCRNGDMLSMQHVMSNNGTGGGQFAWMKDPDGNPTSTMHLYTDDGSEIPVQEGLWFYFLFGYFTPYAMLPAEPTHLRMTEHYRTPREDQRYARDVQTERTFTSQRRDDGYTTVPPAGVGVHCSGWFVHTPVDDEDGWADPILDPCQASDELFLGYDFDLDLDNTLPAGTRRQATIRGYHSPYLATPEPTLRSLKLWLSFDDGAHWKQVTTTRNRDGAFTATFDHPPLSKTTGAVSIRAEATDSAGNTVRQTIADAYGLRAAPTRGAGGRAN